LIKEKRTLDREKKNARFTELSEEIDVREEIFFSGLKKE